MTDREDLEARVEIIDLDDRVPEPGAALRASLAQRQAVALRRPMAQVLRLVAAWGLWSAAVILFVGVRHDRAGLPGSALLGVAAAWTVLVAASIAALLLPPRGQVLPSLTRARVATLVVPLLGIGIALGLLVDAPGQTAHLAGAQAGLALVHCLGLGLVVTLPARMLAWVAARRLLPVGAIAGGAALGAVAGALGGLVLHLVCATGGPLHVGVGHAGGLVLGAALGALLGATRR